MTSLVGWTGYVSPAVIPAVGYSSVGQAVVQRASAFLGAVTCTRAVELGIPAVFAMQPANQGGLCASFVASILSQCGFPDLSLSVQPLMALPDVLRGALLARGFTPVPMGSLPPPGSIVLWPNNEHAAIVVHSDGQTMMVINSNNDHRTIPQTVRFDTHVIALEQRAMVLRPPL
jgi:hypothetical protein